MKVKIREDLINLKIPSYALDDIYYSANEIDNGEVISEDEDSGEVVVKLKDGRIANLCSIDLDFIG